MRNRALLCSLAALFATCLVLSGCSHARLDTSDSDRRIASYQEKNNLLCSIRKTDGTVFSEYAPSGRDQVRDMCKHDSDSGGCGGAIYCKKLVEPNGQDPVKCALSGVSGATAGEAIVGTGGNGDEARDATLWACIQHHSYEDCGAVAPTCSR